MLVRYLASRVAGQLLDVLGAPLDGHLVMLDERRRLQRLVERRRLLLVVQAGVRRQALVMVTLESRSRRQIVLLTSDVLIVWKRDGGDGNCIDISVMT